MANTNPSESKEDIPLDLLSTNLLPSQSPGLPTSSPTATVAPNGAASQTFHRFVDLPPELRNEIWKLSIPHRVTVIPRPNKWYDFQSDIWLQEPVHGAKAEKRPVIAHVCTEARAVALANGSSQVIYSRGYRRPRSSLSRVWFDSKRDTAVLSMGQPATPASGRLHRTFDSNHLYSLLSNRGTHIALDGSWSMCSCIMAGAWARKLYYDLVHGHKECDFVILDLHLDITGEEAAGTGLFDDLDTNGSALIPIEDTRQMSRLFDAQANFDTADWLDKWENFTRFHHATDLDDFIQRWKMLAAREMQNVQKGLDFLTGVDAGRQGKDVGETQEQADRARVIRAEQPKLRPVIMVTCSIGSWL